MSYQNNERTATLLAALAHPNRIRILETLRSDVRCNCELGPQLGLEQSNLSRHLKVLVQAGVLQSWRDGVRVQFKVADTRVFRILDVAESVSLRSALGLAESLEDH